MMLVKREVEVHRKGVLEDGMKVDQEVHLNSHFADPGKRKCFQNGQLKIYRKVAVLLMLLVPSMVQMMSRYN